MPFNASRPHSTRSLAPNQKAAVRTFVRRFGRHNYTEVELKTIADNAIVWVSGSGFTQFERLREATEAQVEAEHAAQGLFDTWVRDHLDTADQPDRLFAYR
jgi:hypothetical protein